MTNLWILKKRRVNLGKHIIRLRREKINVEKLIDARNELSKKIRKLQRQKQKKK